MERGWDWCSGEQDCQNGNPGPGTVIEYRGHDEFAYQSAYVQWYNGNEPSLHFIGKSEMYEFCKATEMSR